MSRLNTDISIMEYEPPMLFGLDSLDSYLTTLDGIIKEEIKAVEKSRPKSFSSEEESLLDGFIDERIISLGEVGQILIDSALVAFYSYFENQIFSFCRSVESNPENLQAMLKDIKKYNGDIDKYCKLVLKYYSITPTVELEENWSKIRNYHLMRKSIVHAFLSKDNQVKLLNHIKSDPAVWYDTIHGSFAISVEYVKNFSRTISSFLSELDFLVYQKTRTNTLI